MLEDIYINLFKKFKSINTTSTLGFTKRFGFKKKNVWGHWFKGASPYTPKHFSCTSKTFFILNFTLKWRKRKNSKKKSTALHSCTQSANLLLL